jgi:acyl-CoA thioesterase YciA
MTPHTLIELTDTTPQRIEFSDVMTVIDTYYDYTPSEFTNGDTHNAAGTNAGSCKIFAFAKLNKLSEAATLSLFGRYYREDVLGSPDGTDHANIRNFMQHGWAGVSFTQPALQEKAPSGRLTTRTIAMHADTNPAGDIFGGWVLSQMDMAAGICAGQRAQTRVVTVALDGMSFIKPVHVGDILGVYTRIVRVGRSSLDVHVECWVRRSRIGQREKVTEAIFKFVALDDNGQSIAVPAVDALPHYVESEL